MPSRPPLRTLIRQRNSLNASIGGALADRAARVSVAVDEVPTNVIPAGAVVELRMTKVGVAYGLALNGEKIPHQDAGVYRLGLRPGPNGLVLVVTPTKDTWAYELHLVVAVDGTLSTEEMDRKSTGQAAGTILEQWVLQQL